MLARDGFYVIIIVYIKGDKMVRCNTCKYYTKDGVLVGYDGRCARNSLSPFNLYSMVACSQYKKSILYFISNTIREEVCNTKGSNCWLSRKYIIREKLEKLNPDIPEDGSVGKIAFDVPGKARMKIRTQRFLTRKLNLNSGYLPDHIISIIANKINSALFPNIRTEIIKEKAITECYKKSVGGGSCMTESCANLTKLYEMNPDKIQMLTMYYMNDSARAILYKLDNDKGYYLDRVYSSCILLEDKMYAYADNNNWISYRNLKYKTDEEKDTLVISDLVYKDGYIPYMDTFEGTISNRRLTLSRSGDFCMDSTSGCLGGEDGGYRCEWCNEYTHEDNIVNIGNCSYCEYCANEHFTFCEHCNEYVPNDDAVRIADKDIYVCVDCARENYALCEDCNDYIEEDYVIIESDYTVCESCSTSTLYEECVGCGEWFYKNNINEDGYCNDCKPKENEHSTHADDPRPYISCKIENTNEISFEENE